MGRFAEWLFQRHFHDWRYSDVSLGLTRRVAFMERDCKCGARQTRILTTWGNFPWRDAVADKGGR